MGPSILPSQLQWEICSFDELSNSCLYNILQLRTDVFVVEQACPFQDMDGLDAQALHVLGSFEESLLCYSRILPPGLKYQDASIGRVITRLTVRGLGMGVTLMEKSIAYCKQRYPQASIRISAQQRLEKFYLELGFNTVSAPYMEDGIPHLEMLLAWS